MTNDPMLPRPFRRALHCLPLAIILLSVLTGCGRVQSVHWVKADFDAARPGGYAQDRLFVASGIDAIRGQSLSVEVMPLDRTLDPARSKIGEPFDLEVWRKDFESVVADAMWQSAIFGDVAAASDEQPITTPTLTLRVALTEYHEGIGWLRLLLGFGLGATRFQWEGELVRNAPPAATADQLLAWADARIHPGGPVLGLTLKPLRGQQLLAEDLLLATRQIQRDLRKLTGVTRAMRESYDRRPKFRPYLDPPVPAMP
jgi:hypothetical protein